MNAAAKLKILESRAGAVPMLTHGGRAFWRRLLESPECRGMGHVEIEVPALLALFLAADEAERYLDDARDQAGRLAAFLAAEMHPPCVQPLAGRGPGWSCPQASGNAWPDADGAHPHAACAFGRRIDEVDYTQGDCWLAWSAEPRETT
jgi:hypothetical protein